MNHSFSDFFLWNGIFYSFHISSNWCNMHLFLIFKLHLAQLKKQNCIHGVTIVETGSLRCHMPISAVFLEPATATKQPASGTNRWAVKRKISRRKLCPYSPFTPTTTVSPTTSLGHSTDLETLYNFVTVKNVCFTILHITIAFNLPK